MNRLANATSPYLLQHKDNPVHWFEWSDEAFAEARERNVPVLLSVGYAACHWCHEVDRSAAVSGFRRNRSSERVWRVMSAQRRPALDTVFGASCITFVHHSGASATCRGT